MEGSSFQLLFELSADLKLLVDLKSAEWLVPRDLLVIVGHQNLTIFGNDLERDSARNPLVVSAIENHQQLVVWSGDALVPADHHVSQCGHALTTTTTLKYPLKDLKRASKTWSKNHFLVPTHSQKIQDSDELRFQ